MKIAIPKPICGVCLKTVNGMLIEDRPLERKMLITVQCHGRLDTCALDYELLSTAQKIFPAFAFKR